MNSMNRVHLAARAVVLVGLAGCIRYTPPQPASPHDPAPVAASFGKTWDAVIDVFGDRTIPIRNMERASGFIATDALPAGPNDRDYADCGSREKVVYAPSRVTYNVVVRGDSSQSTVKMTARWTFLMTANELIYCESRGIFEREFERRIRDRAERRSPK